MSRIYDLILDNLNSKNNENKFLQITDNQKYADYFTTLKSNILSEITLSIKSDTKLYNKTKLYGKVLKDGLIKLDTNIQNSITNMIVQISGEYYFVMSCDLETRSNFTFLKLYPKPEFCVNVDNVNIICVKYVGNYLHQLSSLFYIESKYDEYRDILSTFLNSKKNVNGDYSNKNITVSDNCNETQVSAISNLSYNVELIHGPPGTGKSTTIINIINLALPETHNVLCTAIQNQAIESIVIKLENSNINFVVIGENDRLKETSRKYTLTKHFEKSKEITKLNKEILLLKKDIDLINKYTLDDTSDNKQKMSELKNKYNIKHDRLSQFYDTIYEIIKQTEKTIENEKNRIMCEFKVFLCTIDTSYKFYAMLPSTKHISTVILDEAGSTKESDMLPLLRLNPSNIIMIGDPKQLSAFCDLKLDEEQKMFLTISPLERLIKCGRKHHILTIQYRMKSDMCKIVSKLFYNGILTSDESRNIPITKKTGLSIKWVNVTEKEQRDEKYESFYNIEEIEEIVKLCNKHQGEEIMILTSYNSQLKELNKMLGTDNNDILVRTIDASQGSEASIVILSLTRSNDENKIGFLGDDKRMCVALSRAKNLLYIVGNKNTFKNCGNKKWNALVTLVEKY